MKPGLKQEVQKGEQLPALSTLQAVAIASLSKHVNEGCKCLTEKRFLRFAEISNALNSKGLRLCFARHAGTLWRNIECPEFKGIKTDAFRALSWAMREISNALNSKGLRPASRARLTGLCRNIECPEFKGIKTSRAQVRELGHGKYRMP